MVRKVFFACGVLAGASVLLSMGIGGSGLTFSDIWQALTQPQESEAVTRTILFDVRLPRIVIAVLCGMALSGAGVLSQGMFRNPLASPSIIGTTAGGSSAAAMAFYFGIHSWHWLSLPMAAFAGAAFATLMIYSIASYRRFFVIEHLLLAGFTLNAFLGSLTSLVISLVLEDHEKFPSAMYWLMGGLNAKSWSHVLFATIPISIGLVFAYQVCRKLDVLALGDEIATSLSINTSHLKRNCILIIALLVGTSISIAGAITFVGLIVPHISRLLVGPSHRRLLLLSIVNGISLVVIADTVARTARAPLEIPVGVLIALLGAPFFFWLLFQKDTQRWGQL